MDLKKRDFLTASLLAGAGVAAGPALAQSAAAPAPAPAASKAKVKSYAGSGKQTSMVNLNYKPRRINKAIELWEDDQPVFYTTYAPTGLEDGYEMGKAMAKTWCDAINYECEQGVFDMSNLRKFMQGLVDGGPTPSGHRTPMVFVSSPVTGNDEASINANAWVLQQILAAGAHAIDLCHARDPKAVEAAIAALRYAGTYPGVPPQTREALRGNGSERFASHIWGVTGNKYIHLADFWPLNPRGELAFGVKIEDKVAHANVDKTLAVPGVIFAEWGPGDSVLSVLGVEAFDENLAPRPGTEGIDATPKDHRDPRAQAVRRKVLAACQAHGIKPLNMSIEHDPIAGYKEGTRFFGASDENATLALREYTKRTMPI
ncbi:MAG TPA: hypothetical protein VG960_00800 [Caulobacteraceae bacterium]|nr:hypothetical protein [Caulobacteraceae bacterium]